MHMRVQGNFVGFVAQVVANGGSLFRRFRCSVWEGLLSMWMKSTQIHHMLGVAPEKLRVQLHGFPQIYRLHPFTIQSD